MAPCPPITQAFSTLAEQVRPLVCAFLVLSGSQAGRWVGIAAGAIGCISAI
jgi:hypothetical protein